MVWHGKNPAFGAGFFRLERLLVQRVSGAFGSRFELVLYIRDAVVEARFRRIEAFFQALEAASDGDGDVVGVLVNNGLDLFEVVAV